MFPREALVHEALDKAMRRLAHEHRIWLSQALQTRSEVHGIAEDRHPGVSAILHLPDHSRPSVETDAQLRAHAMFGFEVWSCCVDPLQKCKVLSGSGEARGGIGGGAPSFASVHIGSRPFEGYPCRGYRWWTV